MIKKIAHLSDIHIRKTPTRNEEYQQVFNNLIKSLKKEKVDRIVIVGDLVNDYLHLEGEQLILANKFLYDLAEIAPVRITRGNHDMRKKNIKRVDSVKAIVKTLNNPDVVYYDKTGFYYDENIVWVVWHHGDVKTNPWNTKEGKKILENKDNNFKYIDLFHETVNDSMNDNGLINKSNIHVNKNNLKGDYSFLGHIHKKQYL